MEIGNNLKALEYLLKYSKYYIDQLIDFVMDDSESDPQYSAVTANNLLICFLQVHKMLDHTYPFHTVKEYFFATHYYTEKNYKVFEEKRRKESAYYIGEQFTEEGT